MADAIGSALVIPDSVLKKMDDADKKLARLQDTINKTGNVAATSFRSMANGAYGFSAALDAIIAKLKTVETSSANASAAFNNMKGGNLANAAAQAEKLGASITRAAENIDRLNNKGNTSPLTASAKQYEAIIERLAGIETQLYNKNERLRANDARRAEEAAERKARAAERAAEREAKAAEKAAAAEEKARERQQRAQAKAYQQQNYARNTTYSGALSFAENANTINRRTQAIKYLQAARASLSTTDSEYASKLSTLNARIKELNAANNAAIAGSKNLVNEHRKLLDTTGQLSRAFALLFSVSQIKGYIESIANVRGEFEMSQRSLEAILQNKTQADQIFAQTVELAVKSPYRIKDLVSYTRQLAAYRIESDKLFDTTKRLADVSAGLGVDMSRLILAYGQVKAAAYLRGSEVRQFTEAGVNMYGELQRYFQEVKGEAYTTAQIVDMISKRMVTFADVEAVFKRMTSEGGIFYNMQEIQSETLQGKISNFKDSIDVMLNSIGKANEDTFKGAIDTATTLLEHWEAIADAGKAIAAILLTIKARSMFLNTTLGTAFTQAGATGITRYKALFVNAFNSMGNALKAFGAIAKTSLAGLGIFAVIELISTAIGKWNEYNKKVKEAQEEAIKLRGEIGKISSTYNDLANTATTADTKDLQKNIDERRAALQKLIDSAAKQGLVIKINVEEVKEEDLNRTFDNIKKKYKNFVDDMEVIRRNYAENDSWNTWFTDGLDDDAEDYKDAVLDILSQSSKLEQAIAVVNANYDKATEATKKYFDEIRAGQKEGETNLAYMQRMTAALRQINVLSVGSSYAVPEWLKGAHGNILELVQGVVKVKNAGDELAKEFDDVFGDLRAKYNNDPVLIKAVIDKVASEKDWSQYERDLAYRHFGINVTINKDSIEQEVSWVDDYLSDFFARKKYGVSLVVKEVTDGKALSEFLKKGDDAAKAAKNWQELERRISAVGKNVKQIKVDDSIRKLFKAGDIRLSGEKIDVSTLKDVIAEYKKAAAETSESLGVDPFSKENAKRARSASKQQRDILQEQISLLKEMQEQYEKLTPLMSGEDAAKRVMDEYRDDLQYVKMDKSIIESFVPTKEGVAKALRQLLPTITDFKKKAEVMKAISQLEIEIDKEKLQKQLEGVKGEIDNAFNGLSLYDKLKDLGLSDVEIKRLFGPVTKSFAELREQIEQTFAARFGADRGKWGDDIAELYKEQTEKLAKQQEQQAASEFERLTKAYKSHLDDQLQLDLWYAKERRAIMENEQLAQDRQMRSEYIANLDKEYAQKSDANAWKQFQESDYYIRMFEDLEGTSTRMLNAMSEKLASLRESLKNLSPEQLKQVVDAQQKVDELAAQRNPFRTLAKNLGDYIGNLRKRKELEEEIVTLTGRKDETDKKARMQNQMAESLRNQYEAAVAQSGAESEQAKTAEALWQTNVRILNNLREQSAEYQKQIDSAASFLSQLIKIDAQTKASLMKAGNTFGEAAAVITGVFDSLNDWGLNVEMPPELEEIAGGFEKIDSSLQAIASGKVVSGAVSLLGGIGKTLGGIFGWGTKDKKQEERIEGLTKQVEKLQGAYNDLEQAQADAWSISDLDEYTQKLKANLELQNRNLEAMIAAEQDKKDSDQDRIDEWQRQIDENLKLIGDAEDRLRESLGGFGSEGNYKSTAQAFADAWVDAFNEGSDTLAALEEQYDELIENMLKKQVAVRVADKLVSTLLKPLDDLLLDYDGSPSGLAQLAAGLKELMANLPDGLTELDGIIQIVVEALGMKPSAEGESLSALQQGIQGVTEQTAQALEALLNSIRFFVARQTEDISAIRSLLAGSQSVDTSSGDNPMVTLLREQTGYMRSVATIMEDIWSQAFASGHPKGGRGLKVFF